MSWTEEDRLLLYFCRKEIDDGIKDKIIEAEKNNLDWDSFLKKARENGISAVVYSKLTKIIKDCPQIHSFVFEELK